MTVENGASSLGLTALCEEAQDVKERLQRLRERAKEIRARLAPLAAAEQAARDRLAAVRSERATNTRLAGLTGRKISGSFADRIAALKAREEVLGEAAQAATAMRAALEQELADVLEERRTLRRHLRVIESECNRIIAIGSAERARSRPAARSEPAPAGEPQIEDDERARHCPVWVDYRERARQRLWDFV
jgi:chromosome segregation ATPase